MSTEVMAEVPSVVVRAIRESDLPRLVDIDAASSGRLRPQYFRTIFDRAAQHGGMQMSLVAEIDGRASGFIIATLYYGQFGIPEPAASLEAIGVWPDVRRLRVGHALFQQLRSNLAAIGVTTCRTEVAWTDFELLAFFYSEGFAPAPRLSLECRVDPLARIVAD